MAKKRRTAVVIPALYLRIFMRLVQLHCPDEATAEAWLREFTGYFGVSSEEALRQLEEWWTRRTAEARPKKRGRPRVDLTDDEVATILTLPKEVTAGELAEWLGLSRKTLQRHLKAYLDRKAAEPVPPGSVRPVVPVEVQERAIAAQLEELKWLEQCRRRREEEERPKEPDEVGYSRDNPATLDGGRHHRRARKTRGEGLRKVFPGDWSLFGEILSER